MLNAKIHVPPLGGHRVARSRLLQRLDKALHCPLTVVSAPAGYGKTVLLSYWARRLAGSEGGRRAVPVAWVALEAGDNDPVRFWSYVLAALDCLPPLAGRLTNLLASMRATPEPAIEPVLVTLINLISDHAAAAPLVLVLDDFHVVTAPTIHDSLAYVIEHSPAHLHIVLASRADPPLPLARLRARDGLVELRARDLRFTVEEAAAFLNEVMHLNLPAAAVADLEAHTEGWITGLQLAALSLIGQADPPGRAAAFTGQHRFVKEYLVEEIVGQQSEAV
ncbi:MAG: AAA family ATPase, partial [Anaerolineales bacterium]